jgi:hypothetical protein
MGVPDKAPEGQMYWCIECGRVSGDRNGVLAVQEGWNDQCTAMSMLIDADTMTFENGFVIEADLIIESNGLGQAG